MKWYCISDELQVYTFGECTEDEAQDKFEEDHHNDWLLDEYDMTLLVWKLQNFIEQDNLQPYIDKLNNDILEFEQQEDLC